MAFITFIDEKRFVSGYSFWMSKWVSSIETVFGWCLQGDRRETSHLVDQKNPVPFICPLAIVSWENKFKVKKKKYPSGEKKRKRKKTVILNGKEKHLHRNKTYKNKGSAAKLNIWKSSPINYSKSFEGRARYEKVINGTFL